MTDIQLLIKEPNISFDSCAAIMNGFEQRNAAPVIVVRVTRYGNDISSEVRGVVRKSLPNLPWLTPARPKVIMIGVPEQRA